MTQLERLTSRVCVPFLLVIFSIVYPAAASAQPSAALSGLLANATDFNVFGVWGSLPRGDLKAEGRSSNGLGFELAFGIPGGYSVARKRSASYSSPQGNSCEAQYERGVLAQDTECSDTTVKTVKRQQGASGIAYEEELEIQTFPWKVPVVTLEVAIGFSQTGAYVSRAAGTDIRTSMRELPSVSLYGTYQPGLPGLRSLPVAPSPYFGVRCGLITLQQGRAFTDSAAVALTGETFQLAGALGIVAELGGINVFVEGSYSWRDFKSVTWDTPSLLSAKLPRHLDLSGPSLIVGLQFELKAHAGK